MDEVRRALDTVVARLQDVDHSQRAMARDLNAAAKANDLTGQMAELRSSFAGLAQNVEKLFDQVQDHEKRIEALERKKAS